MINRTSIAGFSLFILLSFQLNAQESKKDSGVVNSSLKKSITFSGLLQTRYTASVTNKVDVNGKQADTGNYVNNGFSLRRVRLQANARVTDHFDASLLVNFAEFSSSNVSNKVLENAFIRYTLNRRFHIIAGQYRPFFGIEDLIPADIIKTLDYSNQYNAFANNGWQGFQLGMCIYGDLNGENKMPVHYYVGVHNGNNRNQLADNDNNKHFYARLEASPFKKTIIGINAATGSTANNNGMAWGGDISSSLSLGKKWALDLSAEFKEGANLVGFSACNDVKPSMNQFKMKGFYVLPTVKYNYNTAQIKSLQFSSRYEYFDDNYKQVNNNPRQTIIPAIAMEFADNFSALLQLGMYIDIYKTNLPFTTQYSHNTAVVQLQVRF